MELIPANVADLVERPKKAIPVPDYYTKEELDTLFKIAEGDPVELAIILASFYGLRRSEIVGLKWKSIDFEKEEFSIKSTVTQVTIDNKTQIIEKDYAKNKSSLRSLPLVKPFADLLLKLKEIQEEYKRVCGNCYCYDYEEYIYVDALGNRIKPNYISNHFSLMLKHNGLRHITFHQLRHSCASLLYANNVPMADIQAWLGHSNISTTASIYTHFDDRRKIESANAIIGVFPSNVFSA